MGGLHQLFPLPFIETLQRFYDSKQSGSVYKSSQFIRACPILNCQRNFYFILDQHKTIQSLDLRQSELLANGHPDLPNEGGKVFINNQTNPHRAALRPPEDKYMLDAFRKDENCTANSSSLRLLLYLFFLVSADGTGPFCLGPL